MKRFLPYSKTLLSTVLLLITFFFTSESFGQTNTWNGSTNANWNTATNWSLNLVPTSAHDVVIPNGSTAALASVTVNTAAVCKTFTISGGANANTVTISGTNSLTVSGALSIGAGTGNGDDKILAVGAGSVSCTSITITATTNSNRNSGITVSSGVVTSTGTITMGDANDLFTFSGSGTLNVGGNMSGGTFTRSTGTVNYYGDGTGGTSSNQTVGAYIYNNLTLSGTGAKTVTGSTINAKLSIQGTATAAGTSPTYGTSGILEYKGSSAQTTSNVEFPATLGADLIIDNTSGVTLNAAKTVSGFITITSGALIANNFNISLSGNWTNNGGSFTAGTSTVTFTGTSTIGGTVATTFFNLTKNTAVVVTNAVDGTTVSGTMSISSGTFIGNNSLTTTYTINVNNFSLTGGTFDSCNTTLAGIAAILAISGSYTQTATSTFTNTGSGVTEVLFTGGGNTTYSNAYTTAVANWQYAIVHVANNTTLTLSTDLMQWGVTATGAIVDAGSTLVTGTRLLKAGTAAEVWEINGTLKTAVTAGLNGSTTTTLDSTNNPVFTLGALSTIEYNSTSAQTITSRADYANITFTGNSVKTAAGAFSASKNLTINSTATFAAATFTHNVAGDWINNGTFTANTSTINFNGASTISGSSTNTFNNISIAAASSLTAQASSNINVQSNWTNNNVFTHNNGTVTFNGTTAQSVSGATTFYNLALTNSGVKTFSSVITTSANLSIATGAQANLGTGLTHSANSLTLGVQGTNLGTWGSTTSAATFKNNTFFGATTGVVNVTANTAATPTVTPTVGTYTYSGVAQGPNTASNTGTATSYTFSYVGVSGTTYGPSATQPTNVGSYTVTASIGDSTDGFYKSASSAATPFSIAVRSLTITASNASKCFGTTYTLGTSAFTSSGLQNGEIIGSVTLTSSGAAPGAAVGSYSIVPSAATGGTFTASNYSITYNNGSLTVNALPSVPTGTNGAICGPGTVNLAASVSGGETVDWYSASSGGTLLLSNSTTYTTASISSTTNYYAEARNTTTGCISSSRAEVTATVNTPSVAPTSITGTTTICNGGSTTLTAIGGTLGTGANYQWGTGAVIGTSPLLGETASTLNISPSSTTTYWVRIENTTSPCTANTSGVTQLVTVNQSSVAPTSISGTPAVCNGSSTTLTAVGGTLGTGANYQWGTGAVVGTSPLSGETASTLTVSPSSATTYWVRIESTTSPCTANTSGVTQLVTVTEPSVAPTSITGTTTICNGGSTILTAVGGTLGTGANYQWGTGAVVGTSPLLGETASTLNISPSSSTTYWVRIENTTSPCAANTNGVTQLVTVNTLSVAPTGATGVTAICAGGNTTLTVDGGSAGTGAVAEWFTGSCGGTSVGTGNSMNFSPTSTTTYYVRYNGTCNTTTCGSVTVTVSTAITWTGAVSTDWNTAGNWSCGAVPNAISDVTISAASNYPVISSDVTINSLTLATTTTLKVNSLYNLTVTDVIDSEGTLTIENNANLLQVNDVLNTGSGSSIIKRNTNPLIRLDYVLWSSPVINEGLFNFSPLTTITPSVRFYTYTTATNLYTSIPSGSINTEQFATGIGYLIRVPFNHPTAPAVWNGVFTGVPNNGDLSVPISTAGTPANPPTFPVDRYGFNLIGNPYPSPISISEFASDNSANIETTFYFWRKTNNSSSPSYCTYNAAGNTFGDNGEAYTEDPAGVIQTGQGFIVQAKTGATAVEFNNGQRLANNAGQFFRTNQQVTASPATIEANRMWLNMQGATGGFSQAVVGYFTNATVGADDFDSKLFNDGPIAFSSIINNEDYVIQGRPVPFDLNDVVPMRYKVTNAGTYTISIDHVDGLFTGGAQAIILKDNLTNTTHDLQTGNYTFSSDAGTFASRFEIIYQPQLGVGNPAFNVNNVIIYQNEIKDFVIKTGNVVMSEVKVFDVRGRLILDKKEINDSQTTINVGQANQVLLVQITSQDGLVVTKKVIR